MSALTERARALLAAATPGPWPRECWYGSDDGGWAAIGPHHEAAEDSDDDSPESDCHDRAMADAALIAAAPTILAALCDELDKASANAIAMQSSAAFFGALAGEFLQLIEAKGFVVQPQEGADGELQAHIKAIKEDLHPAAQAILDGVDALRAEVAALNRREPAVCETCDGKGVANDRALRPGRGCPECHGTGATWIEP